jgi:hypothetical protein
MNGRFQEDNFSSRPGPNIKRRTGLLERSLRIYPASPGKRLNL